MCDAKGFLDLRYIQNVCGAFGVESNFPVSFNVSDQGDRICSSVATDLQCMPGLEDVC